MNMHQKRKFRQENKSLKNKRAQQSSINWFPGHMAKTRRKISEDLKKVDAVAEIIDARIPVSSRNPELAGLILNKPRLVLLNKCDMADAAVTAAWLKVLSNQNTRALALDCRSGKGVQAFAPAVKELLSQKVAANEARGMAGKALRVMVVGIPNAGKSSFINRLTGKSRAKVEDRPGVTRESQWFVAPGGLELLDTPGVLWPRFEDPLVGEHLAFTGAIKDNILDTETLAVKLLEILKTNYPQLLSNRYNLVFDSQEDAFELLCKIARRRGMVVRGGEVDTERAAIMLLDEYRGGVLGAITLERPSPAQANEDE